MKNCGFPQVFVHFARGELFTKSHAKYSKREPLELHMGSPGLPNGSPELPNGDPGHLKSEPWSKNLSNRPQHLSQSGPRELHDRFRGSKIEPLTSKRAPRSGSKHLFERLLGIVSRILASTPLCPAMLRPISKIRPAGIVKRTQ